MDSGVAAQPWGHEETLLGARNRIEQLREIAPQAALWMAIEGGVVEEPTLGLVAMAWVVVQRAQREGVAQSASFVLPEAVAHWLRQGVELGDAMDRVTGEHNIKQGQGAVGVLTQGRVSRQDLYCPAVQLAMIPLLPV